MLLEIFTPQFPLRQFVRSMIYYQGYSNEYRYEKLLPDGNSQLIIELDGADRVVKGLQGQKDIHFNASWITGLQTGPVVYQSEQNASTLCIQFETGGAHALLGIPATEICNTMVEADLVLGRSIKSLRERLLESRNPAEIFTTASGYLNKRIMISKTDQNILDFIVKKTCLENLNQTEMSQQAGYTKKHLIAVFKKLAGLSPKKYQRLIRFNRTLSLLSSQKDLDFEDIVYQCQYFDQAHFIKEFRYFTGTTPSQYKRCSLTYPHVIPFNE